MARRGPFRVRGAQRGELADDLGELVRMFEVDREESLVPRRSAQRLGVAVEQAHRSQRFVSYNNATTLLVHPQPLDGT
jgi:hypothetical protein